MVASTKIRMAGRRTRSGTRLYMAHADYQALIVKTNDTGTVLESVETPSNISALAIQEPVYWDYIRIETCTALPPFVAPGGPPWLYYAKCQIDLGIPAHLSFPGGATLLIEYRNRVDGGDWSAVLSTHADADGVAVLTSGWINRYALAEPQFIEFMVEDVIWDAARYEPDYNTCDGCEQTITDEDMV